MLLIPAIDIIDGKCVRLTQGDYRAKTVYDDDPLAVAKRFEDAGLKRLHLVDLDGAKAGSVQNWKVLENIAGNTSLQIDFGGGIKTKDALQRVFDSGAAFATIGSMAVKKENEFNEWLAIYGPDKFVLGADVRDEKIVVSGWLESTAIDVMDFIEKYTGKGLRQLFCTDVSRDGKMEGPAFALYQRIVDAFPDLFFIASGGVSSMEDVRALESIGCKGVIVGKALYEDKIQLADLA